MSLGQIYKIIHTQSNICYVGSTFDELRKRFQKHITGKACISDHIRTHGADQFKIILIKKYQVYDRKHLQAYEQLWINKLRPINKQQTFTPLHKQFEAIRLRQFQETHRDSMREYKAKYYLERKDELQAKNREWRDEHREQLSEKINCECGGRYIRQHKTRHEQSVKHLNFMNQVVKVEKHGTDRIMCECGIEYSRSNKNVHLKSKKHIASRA